MFIQLIAVLYDNNFNYCTIVYNRICVIIIIIITIIGHIPHNIAYQVFFSTYNNVYSCYNSASLESNNASYLYSIIPIQDKSIIHVLCTIIIIIVSQSESKRSVASYRDELLCSYQQI